MYYICAQKQINKKLIAAMKLTKKCKNSIFLGGRILDDFQFLPCDFLYIPDFLIMLTKIKIIDDKE